MKLLFLLLALSFSATAFSQASVKGVVLNEENSPLENVNVSLSDSPSGTSTNANGFFDLRVPSDSTLTITFSALGYKKIILKNLRLEKGEIYEVFPVMNTQEIQIGTVYLDNTTRKQLRGMTSISPEVIENIPGAQPGVENLIKSLPGVAYNNELSTQYAVRGGNYDENLIYINEIEVYRPLLIRSGQQEGLSVVNSDLTRSVDFSAGGFQAQYGDKLSSVLDIKYRRPKSFTAGIDASFLGANVFAGGEFLNGTTTGIMGLRYRNNSLFVNSRDTEANARPVFYDAQLSLVHRLSPKFAIEFLGNIAINDYEFEPVDRETRFGTVADPRALVIDYSGFENDRYETYFGAVKLSYDVADNLNFRLISSLYHTQEQEHFDILAVYALGRPDSDFGGDFSEIGQVTSAGAELEHGRNDLDGLIGNIHLRGTYEVPSDKAERDLIDFGVKYQREDFRDRVQEYTVLDSAGFSLRPPIEDFRRDEPYEPFTGPLEPFTSIRAYNEVQTDRLEAFAQYGARGFWGDHEIFWNAGARFTAWNVGGPGLEESTQSVISPRAQFAIKPDWEENMIFRLKGGLYYQPPFYRELRDETGAVVPDVKAQRSTHIVLGHDWKFKLRKRDFQLTSEVFYKDLTDVNTYTLENVRIRYRANNDAEAYAYGVDLRLNGEFVPGTESWVTASYLKTEERLEGRDEFISRPTDQRLKFAVLFQDYVPRFPQLRAYLNMVYQTGLPGGSPNYADPYLYQFRLDDYIRADLGINYVFKDAKRQNIDAKWLKNFKELSLGVEVFNIFNNQNSITNIWVRDISSGRQIAIPNFLTPQVFNVRLRAKF